MTKAKRNGAAANGNDQGFKKFEKK